MNKTWRGRALTRHPVAARCMALALAFACAPAFPSHAMRAQEPTKRIDGILLVVPEADTVTTPSAAYRLSASVLPGWRAMVNGVAAKVYPSGAFDGLLDLAVGENPFTITAVRPNGTISTRSFLIVRTPLPETARSDTLAIEGTMMEPALDTWLMEGDLLKVQCVGTPHCKATFLDGNPMRELPPGVRGIGGIYQGVYRVTAADAMDNRPIVFRLEDSAGRSVTRESPGAVSFNPSSLPLVGVTIGDRPALRYGIANDRLGGAVFSYLSPGVKLAITGKIGEDYRVALAQGYEAWIDSGSLVMQSPGTHPPEASTGNWHVYGDDRYDYVSISVGDRLPYASSQELDPARVNIDLFGAVANSNWIIQKANTKEIKSVDYSQTGKNVLRIAITLSHKHLWGYSVSYSGNTLIIRIRHQPEALNIGALTFALDAGHGGTNTGALGCTGIKEKDVTLSVVRHLRDLLEDKGAKVILTRDADTTIATSDRLRRVLASDADLLISVHVNSIGLTSNPEETKGVSTFYKYLCYRPLSEFLLSSLQKTGVEPYGNIGSFNFSLVSPTELPSVLVELAYISNPEDEMKLIDDDFRVEAAKRMMQGIRDFLDSCSE